MPPINSSAPAPHHLASLYDDFFIGGGAEDARYIDGLIVQTNRGNMATLYAKEQATNGSFNSRKLDQIIKAWDTETDNPFHYAIKPLPASVIEKLCGTKHEDADQLLTIIGMDLKTLTREVKYAKKVLSALGLRSVGPADPDDEKEYHISSKKLMSITRKTAEETTSAASFGLEKIPLSAHQTIKHVHGLETDNIVSYSIDSDDVLPVGATREWLFLKAIAVAAGVPGQPTDSLALYRSTINQKTLNTLESSPWAVMEHTGAAKSRTDKVNLLLNDASQIRHFLVDKLSQMESRFTLMGRQGSSWGTRLFDSESSLEHSRRKEAELFRDVADTITSLKIQAENSLSAGPDDDLFAQLQHLGSVCENMGGIPWAAKDFVTLAYATELLNIVERHALYFQQGTVDRINNGQSVLPEGVLAAMQGIPVEIQHGYGQRLEGQMVNPGYLPAGFPGEFPCVKQGDRFIMVPGATVEENLETGLSVLSTPTIPEIPRWLMQNASPVPPVSDATSKTAQTTPATPVADFFKSNTNTIHDSATHQQQSPSTQIKKVMTVSVNATYVDTPSHVWTAEQVAQFFTDTHLRPKPDATRDAASHHESDASCSGLLRAATVVENAGAVTCNPNLANVARGTHNASWSTCCMAETKQEAIDKAISILGNSDSRKEADTVIVEMGNDPEESRAIVMFDVENYLSTKNPADIYVIQDGRTPPVFYQEEPVMADVGLVSVEDGLGFAP
jgi:hypothetical protein